MLQLVQTQDISVTRLRLPREAFAAELITDRQGEYFRQRSVHVPLDVLNIRASNHHQQTTDMFMNKKA